MFLTILSCDKLGTFIACFDVFTHYWPAKSSSATLTEFVWCFLWRSSVISVCLRSLGSNSDNNIWAKVMYLNKCIRLNVIFREPSLLNLCTVHSLRGRMLMAFCFCSLHLVLIKCCESKSMCCNFVFFCTARYSLILYKKHFMYWITICILWWNLLKGKSYFVSLLWITIFALVLYT